MKKYKKYPFVEQKEQELQEKIANEKFCCPKCGNYFTHIEKQDFNIVAGAIGTAVFNDVLIGAIIGSSGKDKIFATCLKCGHKWKI